MAKFIDKVRTNLIDNMVTLEEIDRLMESKKYYPVETEDCTEDEGVLKYSNKKSELWLKYIYEDGEYLVYEVTMKTKKYGKTEVDPFYREEDLKGMIDYFRTNETPQNYLIFMLDLLLARRIGDTVSLKWSDFYYENGRKKDTLNTLVEQKTEKTVDISITNVTWKHIEQYCEVTGINPMEHYEEDMFPTEDKTNAKTDKEYDIAIKKQAAAFRYVFKKAADTVGVPNVSTHSLRKSFGYIAHEINRFDPDCLDVLQTVYGHTDKETTKTYIGIMREKARNFFNDVAQRIEDISNGVKSAIDNLPVIAMRTNDLRDVLLEAIEIGRNTSKESDADTLKELLSKVESMRVS